MLKSDLAKLETVPWMEIGLIGNHGPSAACLVVVGQEKESGCVLILSLKMEAAIVLEVMHRWTIVTMIHAQFMVTGLLGVIGALAHPLVEEEKGTDTDHAPAHPLKMVDKHAQDMQVKQDPAVCKCVHLMEIGLIGDHGLHVRIRMVKMYFVVGVVKKDSEHVQTHLPSLEEKFVLVIPCKRKSATLNHVISHHSKHLVRSLETLMMKNLESAH